MSRVAKAPINVPAGVEITVSGQDVKVKGKVGELSYNVNPAVEVVVGTHVPQSSCVISGTP